MSLSFLGLTAQNVSKVVFIVSVGPTQMDIRKGGFRAFEIIRRELMQQVAGLPPQAEFNVILYGDNPDELNLFSPALVSASSLEKNRFFAWLNPVNANPARIGVGSASARLDWRPRPLPPDSGINPLYLPPLWVAPTHAALEMQPSDIFLITGSAGSSRRRASDAELADRERELAAERRALEAQGIDVDAVLRARAAALQKASMDLRRINQQLQEQNKDPLIVYDITRVAAPDFQAALAKAGVSLKLDTTGWTDARGRPIWWMPKPSAMTAVPYTEVYSHLTRLQRALVPGNARLNIFFFVGQDEKRETEKDNLTTAARRNGGNFRLLTAQSLETLAPSDRK